MGKQTGISACITTLTWFLIMGITGLYLATKSSSEDNINYLVLIVSLMLVFLTVNLIIGKVKMLKK
jgi:arginine exporter protein ArgO